MADDSLSRQELDALLRGVDDEAQQQARVHRCDLGHPQGMTRAALPALQLVNERFADLMRVALFNFTRKSVQVAAERARLVEYGEFVRELTAPCSLSVVQAKPLRGMGLVVFDAELVAQTTDRLFGGQGRVAAREPGRSLTAAETRVARRLLTAVCDAYARAWEPALALRLEHLRSETDARLANIAAPAEPLLASSFRVESGSGDTRFHVCLPYAILDPIRAFIDKPARAGRGEADAQWTALLAAQLAEVEVELAANLASATISVRQLLRLEAGDVIGIDPRAAITAAVAGVPVLEGKYGVANGRYALKVTRKRGPGA